MSSNLLEEIFAERLEERFAQGRAEEARMLLRRYLERRFGAIPPALDERIAAADADSLTVLFDRALAAATIDVL